MNSVKGKWIIWGTGKKGQELYDYLSERGDNINVIAVVDISEKKWGSTWNGYLIESPDILLSYDFDKLIIGIEKWRPVYKYAMSQYKIQQEKLDNYNFILREKLLEFYSKKSNSEEEERQLNYIKKFPLDVFNDDFPEKYLEMKVDVYLDQSVQMFYVYYHGKKMYFPKDLDKEDVEYYYPLILMEQDKKSPHKYENNDFMVETGEIVLDIGAAEGNFSLDVIDRVKKLYIVESDKRWIEALEKTFEPYKEKVQIIKKYVYDYCDEACITIDELSKLDKFTSIKMDIEGAEVKALKGGEKFLRNSTVKAFICSYHTENQYKEILKMLDDIGKYYITATDGFMVFIHNINLREGQIPKLVKGVIRAKGAGLKIHEPDYQG